MNLRDDKVSEEAQTLISSLPIEIDALGNLYKYQGCWYDYETLQGILNFKRGFKPRDTDVILATFPKSGTTWIKALTVALTERSKHLSDDDHPLLSYNPHTIVPYLEFDYESPTPDVSKFSSSSSSSPRLFSTHMPLHTLQETLKDSPCKIVYLCRNPKDVVVSLWYFSRTNFEKSITLESMFDLFCKGAHVSGPFWEIILSYWRGSLTDPNHVLFMRYEELKTEPRVQIKKLAEFLGCPFTKEEENSGSVDKILELCSLRNLSGLEANKTGKTKDVHNSSFFRKGEVGDWKNHLTPEMVNKIDKIVEEKLRDSNLKF